MKEHLFNRINEKHKRALSLVYNDLSSNLVYNDFSSGFSELLEKYGSVTILYCNFKHGTEILREFFSLKKSNYNLGNRISLQDKSIKTAMYGWGTTLNRIKKYCVSYIIQKENS